MNSDRVLANNEMVGAFGKTKPYASYIKVILGQVAVTVWDNVLNKPVDVILKGNPKTKDEDSIVHVWDENEDKFLHRMNRSHFTHGTLVRYDAPENVEPVKTIEQSTDDELKSIINSKYFSLLGKLSEINTIPVLFRMKNLAEEMDKSSKITEAIQKRISELQTAEYIKPAPEKVEEE
jgi:hypothetical protein